ncbi:MAG: hypothetical protein ABIA59_05015 [Candidatus Latescibacterota bacterium]
MMFRRTALLHPSSAILALIVIIAGCSHFAPRKNSGGPAAGEDGIRFHFYAPGAGRVQLAGDWPGNNWAKGDGISGEENIGLMNDDDGDGLWEIVVWLSPGKYRYLFWVDENTWHLDPGNPEEITGGPAGKCSQIVLVPRQGKLEMR